MADNRIPTGITLNEPDPKPRRPIGSRLLYLGIFVACGMAALIATGIFRHHQQSVHLADERLKSHIASGPGKSNRAQIEHGYEPKVATPETTTHPQIAIQPAPQAQPQNQQMQPQISPLMQMMLDREKEEAKFEQARRDAPLAPKHEAFVESAVNQVISKR